MIQKECKAQRKNNHMILFNLNRQIKEQQFVYQQDVIKVSSSPPIRQQQFIEDIYSGYAHVLKLLNNRKYTRNSLPRLLDNLKGQFVMAYYESVIGLQQLSNQILKSELFFELCDAGLFKKLARLFLQIDHPFLQLNSAKIIIQFINHTPQSLFLNYFDSQKVPFENIIQLFSSQNFIINIYGIILFLQLVKRSYKMKNPDPNKTILSKLQLIFGKLKENNNKQQQISHLLYLLLDIKINFKAVNRQFVNWYLLILKKMIEYSVTHHFYGVIMVIINFMIINIDNFLQPYSINSLQSLNKMIQTSQYVYETIFYIINIDLDDPIKYETSSEKQNERKECLHLLLNFKHIFFLQRQGQLFITKDYFSKIINQLIKQYYFNKTSQDMQIYLQILQNILNCQQTHNYIDKDDSKNLCIILSNLYELKITTIILILNKIICKFIQIKNHIMWNNIINENLIDKMIKYIITINEKNIIIFILKLLIDTFKIIKQKLGIQTLINRMLRQIYSKDNKIILKNIRNQYKCQELCSIMEQYDVMLKLSNQEERRINKLLYRKI